MGIARTVYRIGMYRLTEVAESNALTARKEYFWEHETTEDRQGNMRWSEIGSNHFEDLCKKLGNEIGIGDLKPR